MFLIKEFSVIFYLLCFLLFSTKSSQAVPFQLRTNGAVLDILKRVQSDKFFPFRQDFLSLGAGSDSETDDDFSDDAEGNDPEVRPNLFQGDIALDVNMLQKMRLGLSWTAYPERKWPNRTIPYAISKLYEPEDRIVIQEAIRQLNLATCLKYVPWDGKANDYLIIWPFEFPKGCWSFLGRIGGQQPLSLQPPSDRGPNCLGSEGRAIHELLHAAGIFHEQSRADRDFFVKVHWENIIKGYEVNFEKQSVSNTTHSFEYDYRSLMHYGAKYFRKFQTAYTHSINYMRYMRMK